MTRVAKLTQAKIKVGTLRAPPPASHCASAGTQSVPVIKRAMAARRGRQETFSLAPKTNP